MNRVLGIDKIKAILPQRYPMLMLDRVEILGENKAVGLKNLCINELFFQGHFPNHPIMPGVLQVEAMKQLGEILARPFIDPRNQFDVYMQIVEKVKFRKPNNPGDRVKIEAELVEHKGASAIINASCSNASGMSCEAVITLSCRDKKMTVEMPELYTEYDKNDNTPMDVNKIMELVPHRYPFLLIDNIAKVEGDHVIAIKNVSANEEIFAHCPDDYAVLSEALLCEIVAQSGCACVLSRPENAGKIGYFMSIDRAESFAPVYPGDQIICDIELPPGKSRFGKGSGIVRVGDTIVFKITLMFAIVDA